MDGDLFLDIFFHGRFSRRLYKMLTYRQTCWERLISSRSMSLSTVGGLYDREGNAKENYDSKSHREALIAKCCIANTSRYRAGRMFFSLCRRSVRYHWWIKRPSVVRQKSDGLKRAVRSCRSCVTAHGRSARSYRRWTSDANNRAGSGCAVAESKKKRKIKEKETETRGRWRNQR